MDFGLLGILFIFVDKFNFGEFFFFVLCILIGSLFWIFGKINVFRFYKLFLGGNIILCKILNIWIFLIEIIVIKICLKLYLIFIINYIIIIKEIIFN